jgi:hypothetical protein
VADVAKGIGDQSRRLVAKVRRPDDDEPEDLP